MRPVKRTTTRAEFGFFDSPELTKKHCANLASAAASSSAASSTVSMAGGSSRNGSSVADNGKPLIAKAQPQKIDEDLHSRQLAVYGSKTMCRLFSSNVLISGMQGLGAEIVKNLILAGVKSVTLHDEGTVELWDLSSSFIFSEDVGKNRALASVSKLQKLNNSVIISTLTIFDIDGEDPHSGIIASISNDNTSLVACVEVKRLEFQDGDLVVFAEVRGMTELNDGKPRKIKNSRPYSFTIEEDTTNYAQYESGGTVTQVKEPKVLNFKPLHQALNDLGDFLPSDFSKIDRAPLLHLAFQSLDNFRVEMGRFSLAGSEEDAKKVVLNPMSAIFWW